MPSKRNGKGKPEWQSIDGSNHLTKLSKGLEAGLKRQKQFVQPIDVVLTYAGSEATKAFEHYGVEDDVARGMLSSQCSMSVDLQNIVGCPQHLRKAQSVSTTRCCNSLYFEW